MRAAEAKKIIVNDIAPTLNPEIKGNFQVVVHGADEHKAKIELRICDPSNKNKVLYSFGSVVQQHSKPVTLQDIETKINFNGEN